MSTVRISGVPEHFNFPWHLAMEDGAFSDRGIDLAWSDTPEGSGKMAKMLAAGETDLAIILTEGIVKAIGDGVRAVICQEFIASPLLWGIHVAAASPYRDVADLRGKVAAISRFGSGSHLMAHVHAREAGWETGALSFEVVNTLEGAIDALQKGGADYFMWEKFTTQPVVDRGIFRRIGLCPTPWPCFVVAARTDFARQAPALLRSVLDVINTYTSEFRDIPSIDRTLANRYEQKLPAIQQWMGVTRWSQEQIKKEDLENVIFTLQDLKLLEKKLTLPGLLL